MSDLKTGKKFSLFLDDPFYRLLSLVKLTNKNGRPKTFYTIIFIFFISWGIPGILSFIQGYAINADPKLSYLYDFAAYAQYILAIPLLIIAETYIDEGVEWSIFHLFNSTLIKSEDYWFLESKLTQANKTQSNIYVSIGIFIFALMMGAFYALGEFTNGVSNWHSIAIAMKSPGQFEHPTWAGWWNALISQTILVYFVVRWIWKIAIWYWVIRQISKCKLQLHALHPDLFGGIGFFLSVQSRFSLVILAIGVTMATTNSYKIIIEKDTFTFFSTTTLGALMYFLIAPLIFIVPLLFFTPILSKTKRYGILKYSILAMKYSKRIDEIINLDEGQLIDFALTGNGTALFESININDENPPEIITIFNNLSSIKDHYLYILKMHTIPVDFQRTGKMFIAGLLPLFTQIVQPAIISRITEYIR
jgi:hypothetical protein